jgi:hypothetical protein
MERVTVPSRRSASKRRRRIINSLRPLSFEADGNRDLDVLHIHLFDDQGRICVSLLTGSGTATFTMPVSLAHEVGDGLNWLATQQETTPADPEDAPRWMSGPQVGR